MNHQLLCVPRILILGVSLVLALTSTTAPAQSATLVKDINRLAVPATSSTPTSLHASGPYVYMAATSRGGGRELYRTLGSVGGANLVKDIHPGVGNSYPSSFHTVGNNTYFAASDGKNGKEVMAQVGFGPTKTSQFGMDLSAGRKLTLGK